jgi:hypothetical protein
MAGFHEEVAKMEYERLVGEIVSIQKEGKQLAQYAVVIAAAICVAMVNSEATTRHYRPVLKFIPAVVVLLFGYRVWSQFTRLDLIANYLKDEYEARFHGADVIVPKWETHLANYLKRQKPFWGSPRWSVLVFWFVLFAATMVVAFVF